MTRSPNINQENWIIKRKSEPLYDKFPRKSLATALVKLQHYIDSPPPAQLPTTQNIFFSSLGPTVSVVFAPDLIVAGVASTALHVSPVLSVMRQQMSTQVTMSDTTRSCSKQ